MIVVIVITVNAKAKAREDLAPNINPPQPPLALNIPNVLEFTNLLFMSIP